MTWSCATNSRALPWRAAICGLALATTLVSDPAHAVGQPETKPGAKGTVGLALLGAESVMTVEAAFGVQPWWAYAVGGGIGAIGGGVGGYFIDKGGNTQVSMSLLVGGLVLAVPTTIAVLSATSYKPPQNPEIDSGVSAETAALERYHQTKFDPAPSLVRVSHEGFKMDVPAVSVGQVFSEDSRRIYGLPTATAVEMPVLNLRF